MTQQDNYINFNKKTVFVVGAGASIPYGYPLGYELVDKIVAVAGKSNNEQAEKFIKLIKLHDPFSIDSFLAQHCSHDPDLTNFGKQLIAEVILSCEDRDKIAGKSNNENWYRYLTHAMFADKERLINDEPLPFKIITFNYDVSLDYYLLERVWKATMLSDDEKKKVLKKLDTAITHVYGAVRQVPWNNPEVLDDFKVYLSQDNKKICVKGKNEKSSGGTSLSMPRFEYGYHIEEKYMPYIYGSHNSTSPIISQGSYVVLRGEQQPTLGEIECGKQLISKAAKRIKVIDERNEKIEENLQPFKQYIAEEAQRIMFLGFGFDEQNMDLLFNYKIIENIHSRNEEQYRECVATNEKEYFEKFEICYTNYEDSEKLNRRIENYCRKTYFAHFKSIKGVNKALTEDFDLS